MKDSLRTGIEYELRFVVPESKTMPNLYPEPEEFGAMPEELRRAYFSVRFVRVLDALGYARFR